MFSIRLFLCFLILTGALFTNQQAFAQQAPLKIAVVDMERVLRNAVAPKSIREQVKNFRDKYKTEVQKEEALLRQSNQDLAQKQSLLSPDAFKAERRKFEQKVLEVQKKVQQKNLSLQNAQNDAQNKVKIALRDTVLSLSKDRGYSLVLRNAQTIVVADQLDITKDVIAGLNKKLPSIKVFK